MRAHSGSHRLSSGASQMVEKWFVRRSGKVVGSVAATKFIDLAKSGKLLPTDEVSQDGGKSWTSASSFFAAKVPSSVKEKASVGKSVPPEPPLDEQGALSAIAADYTEVQKAKLEDSGTSDGFAMERQGIANGVLGGFSMIAIAVIWFGLGWWAGYIFFYPPVLFIIGAYAVLKGLWTGNMRGVRSS